jgi:hypothetical protein
VLDPLACSRFFGFLLWGCLLCCSCLLWLWLSFSFGAVAVALFIFAVAVALSYNTKDTNNIFALFLWLPDNAILLIYSRFH